MSKQQRKLSKSKDALGKQKSISAIRTINFKKTQYLSNDNFVLSKMKQIGENNLTKKQLLLKLDQIKQLKDWKYRGNVNQQLQKQKRQNKTSHDKKRTIYSNFKQIKNNQKPLQNRRQIQQYSQLSTPHQYRSNLHLALKAQINTQKKQLNQKQKYFSEVKKKVVSLGAGFKKRSRKFTQNADQSPKKATVSFKLSRSKSKNFSKRIQKLQSQKLQKQQRSNIVSNKLISYKTVQTNPCQFKLIPEVVKFREIQQNKQQNSMQVAKSIKQIKFKLNQFQEYHQLNLRKQKEHLPPKINDLQQIIQNLQRIRKKQDITVFFEQNGFGINHSLQKFDLLWLQDEQGQIFNRLFQNQVVQCPLYEQKNYKWMDVKVFTFDLKKKKVLVEICKNQKSISGFQNRNKDKSKTIEVNRMSIKIKSQQMTYFYNKLKQIIKKQQFDEAKICLIRQYIKQDFWNRIKKAKQRLSKFKSYQKYLRYLSKLDVPHISFQNTLGYQPCFKQLEKKFDGYQPSQNINFEKRISANLILHNFALKQCHEVYFKHFLIMQEMYLSPLKFTSDLRIIIQKPLKYIPNILKFPQFALSFQGAKSIMEQNLYYKIPNFQTAIKSLINYIFDCGQNKLNIKKMVQRIGQTQMNFVQAIMKQCGVYSGKNSSKSKKGMTLQNFVKFFTSSLNYILQKLAQNRELIISQVLYHLQDSFNIPHTNKNKKFVQSLHQIKKSNQIKYFSLVNNIFVQIVNQIIWQDKANQFLQWLLKEDSVQVFRLNISIDNKKQIQFDPQKCFFQKSLETMLRDFCKRIEQTGDILGDLLLIKDNKIPIFNKMEQRSKEIIKKFIAKNYKIIFEEIETNISQISYFFQPFGFNIKQLSEDSLVFYDQLITKMEKAKKSILRFFITRPSIFVVNLSQLKQIFVTQIQKKKEKTLKRIQKNISQQVETKYTQFSQIQIRLSFRPSNQQQYVQMKFFVQVQCQEFLQKAEQHYRICQLYFTFFENHCYQYGFDLYIINTKLLLEHNRFKKKIDQKQVQLDIVFQQLIERINQDRDKVYRGADSVRFKIQQISNFSQFQEYARYHYETNKCFYELKQYQSLLQNINSRQGLLKQQKSLLPALIQLNKDIEPYFQLYTAVYEIKSFDLDWKNKPLMTLNHGQIKQKFVRNQTIFDKLYKSFTAKRNSEALSICEAGRQVISKNQNILWVVQYLTKQAMVKKSHILKEAMDCIYEGTDYNIKQVNLDSILKQSLTPQKRAFVIQKCILAQKIYNLQKHLQSVTINCKKLYVRFQTQKKLSNLPFLTKIQIAYLVSCLEEQKQEIEIIEGNQVAHIIEKKISYVLHKVVSIQQTLEMMRIFQQIMFKVLKILFIKEIKNQFLKQETDKIRDTQNLWRNITANLIKQPQLWQGIDSDHYRNKLLIGFHFFEDILVRIQKIIDQKMKIFPKLFFIPKQTFMKLLQEGNSVQLPTQILKTIYGNGFNNFILNDQTQKDKKIIGVQGQCREIYNFKNLINVNTIFWNKYLYIEEEISKLNKAIFSKIIKRIEPEKNYQQLLISFILRDLLNWTDDVDKLIKTNDCSQDKIISKWSNFDQFLQDLDKVSQKDKILIRIQNRLFLRDQIFKILNIEKDKRQEKWEDTIKYKIMQFGKQLKICLNYSLFNPTEKSWNQINLNFGRQLADYQSYPLNQFIQSQNLQSQFRQYLNQRELQFCNCLISKKYKQTYEKIIKHTMNHFVNVQFKESQQKNIFLKLQTNLKGFLLAQSYGLLDVQINKLPLKADYIKLLAYYFERIYKVLEEKTYSIQIYDISVKITRQYRTNFSISLQSLQKQFGQRIIERRLFNTRSRVIQFCQPDQNLMWHYLIQSCLIIKKLNKEEKQQLQALINTLISLLKKLQYSRSKITIFVKSSIEFVNHSTLNKSKIMQNLVKRGSNQILKQKQLKQINDVILKNKPQFVRIEKFLKEKNNNNYSDIIKQKIQLLTEVIQIEEIRSIISFEQINLFKDQQVKDEQKKQMKIALCQQFEKMKVGFINDKFKKKFSTITQINKSLKQQSIKRFKNKIIISGERGLSFKTSLIKRLLNSFCQKNANFQSYKKYVLHKIAQVMKYNDEQNEYQLRKIEKIKTEGIFLQNIVCNFINEKIVPTIQCEINEVSLFPCQKWHYYQDIYILDSISKIQENKKVIIETSAQTLFKNLNPRLLGNSILISIPSSNLRNQQLIDYEYCQIITNRLLKNDHNFMKEAKKSFLIFVSDKQFLARISKLNFIYAVKNYFKLSYAFLKENQSFIKDYDNTELCLMVLAWSIFPYFQIQQSSFTSKDLNSSFQKPIHEIYNWFYSVQKHTWVQWVTLTQFLQSLREIKQNSLDQNIYIPVNQSVSFTYFIQKVSNHAHIIINSQEKHSGKSFLFNLLLKRGFYSSTTLRGLYSFQSLKQLFKKQCSKINEEKILIPNKSRVVKFIIQDVNFDILKQNDSQIVHKQYLKSLLDSNYDNQRKMLFEKINFIVTISESQNSNKQRKGFKQLSNNEHCLFKEFVRIKLKKYSQQSCKFIFSTYLEEFFGNTDNPYSKQIRQVSNILISQVIKLKSQLQKSLPQLSGFPIFFKSLLRLKASTPKVVKEAEHIVHLLNFQLKRQLADSLDFLQNSGQAFHQLSKCYNYIQNDVIQKLLFNDKFEDHKKEFGIQDFSNQKIQNLRNSLSRLKLSGQNKSSYHKFFNQQDISFCKIPIKQNSTQYKQQYRFYEGLQYLEKVIEANLIEKHSSLSEIPVLIDKQFLSNLIKIMRTYTLENQHGVIIGPSIQKIKKLSQISTYLSFNHQIKLEILSLRRESSLKQDLLSILRHHFKKYLKSQKIHKLPIFIEICQELDQIKKKDLEMICQYIETNQFITWLYESKQKSYKSNLMKQMKIKSQKSTFYSNFVKFCKQSIHILVGIKSKSKQNQRNFLKEFSTITKKCDVKLKVNSANQFSKIQISTKTLKFNKELVNFHMIIFKLAKIQSRIFKENDAFFEQKYLNFCQITQVYLKENDRNIEENVVIRSQATSKINQIFEFKKYLERKLEKQLKNQVNQKFQLQTKFKQLKKLLQIQLEKQRIFQGQNEQCWNQQAQCKKLEQRVQEQMSKVGPILEKAQAVLQKVTRDDINQLRSFPNPPLPAAKVCQSLIFVFDEVNLVKQKVLQNGEKIFDFWEYAKKFILNDKLLKRISDYNSQTIKNLKIQVIQSVRDITNKPQFIEQKVFKASIAAGNLSLWIRAVISTFDVMYVLEPVKKQLRQALLQLTRLNQILEAKKGNYLQAKKNVQSKNQQIQKVKNSLQSSGKQIKSIHQQIFNIDKLLVYLQKYKVVWNQQIKKLKIQQKVSVGYFLIWEAFSITFLGDKSEQQILKFYEYLIKNKQGEMQLKFIEFMKNFHLTKHGYNIVCQMQLSSLLLLSNFENSLFIFRKFIKNCVPFCFGQNFIKKFLSIFHHLKLYDYQFIKAYWLVDQTSTLKYLLQANKLLNQIDANNDFQIQVVSVFDCFQFTSLSQYILKTGGKPLKNNQEPDSDEESDQQLQTNQIDQSKASNKTPKKRIILIKNLEDTLTSFQSTYHQIVSYFNSQGIIPVFITKYSNHLLEKYFQESCKKILIDLSQNNFVDLLRNGINFLKQQNSKFYQSQQEIYEIKKSYDRILRKLSFNKKFNSKQDMIKYSKIQILLQNDEEVVKLIGQFQNIEDNKIKTQKLKKGLFDKKKLNEHDQFQATSKKIFGSSILNSNQKKSSLNPQNEITQSDKLKWRNYMTFQDLLYKYFIENVIISEVLKDLSHHCKTQSEQRQNILIENYLSSDSKEDTKHLYKFIQKLSQAIKKHSLKSLKVPNSFQFPQILNCIMLQTKGVNVIGKLKQKYKQALLIVEPNPILDHKIQVNYKDLMSAYSKGFKMLILATNMPEAKRIANFIQKQLLTVIYQKCIQQKQMNQKQLLRYLEEQQIFKVFILLEQKQIQNYQKLNNQNQKENLLEIWSQNEPEYYSLQAKEQGNNQITKIKIQKLFQILDERDEQKYVISQKTKVFFNTI